MLAYLKTRNYFVCTYPATPINRHLPGSPTKPQSGDLETEYILEIKRSFDMVFPCTIIPNVALKIIGADSSFGYPFSANAL